MAVIDLEVLRWSQYAVHDHFKDGTSVFETVVRLLLGEVGIADLPSLNVVQRGRDVSWQDSTSRQQQCMPTRPCLIDHVGKKSHVPLL